MSNIDLSKLLPFQVLIDNKTWRYQTYEHKRDTNTTILTHPTTNWESRFVADNNHWKRIIMPGL